MTKHKFVGFDIIYRRMSPQKGNQAIRSQVFVLFNTKEANNYSSSSVSLVFDHVFSSIMISFGFILFS